MIIRLSQKLAIKIKAGKLPEMHLHANKISDWSPHVFNANRKQYILLCNTSSFYSCLAIGKGVTSEVERLIAPSRGSIRFAKALNRAVIGSMNDHVQASKMLLDNGMRPNEIGTDSTRRHSRR